MIKTFRVLVWMDALALNWPDGKYVDLQCAHVNEGEWGVNMNREIIPLPTSTVPLSETGSQFEKEVVGVPAGRAYTDTKHFTDAGFKVCVRVKEIGTNNVYYVDKTSYDTEHSKCNDCCTPGECVAPTPEVTAGPTSTTATIGWDDIERAVGYEWVLTEEAGDCEDPVGAGTFAEDNSVALTGLTAETEYCFAVRTICGAGRYSDWAFVQFTTLA